MASTATAIGAVAAEIDALKAQAAAAAAEEKKIARKVGGGSKASSKQALGVSASCSVTVAAPHRPAS
jgi:hypothetical protein